MKNGNKYKAIVIGSSAGGMEALRTVLSVLPESFEIPILISQHLSPSSDNYITQYLNKLCKLEVKEADEKENIQVGKVYFAPPNFHLLVEKDKTLSLSTDSRVNFARPSIDVMFETAAWAYGSSLIGIVLTGANFDGSNGLKIIKDFGGLTIVQDPKTAHTPTMPEFAIAATKVDHILPINKIGEFLTGL